MNFKNTSNWEKKNKSTILYRYEYQGERKESDLVMEPTHLWVNIERLSVVDRTTWEFSSDKRQESITGFLPSEHIRVIGKLRMSCVHAFVVGEAKTATLDKIEVLIYPVSLEELQETSRHNYWTVRRDNARPDDGWLQDEIGRLEVSNIDENKSESSLYARLALDNATFEALVQKIKSGGALRSAQLQILADLFQDTSERAFAEPEDTKNFGLMCKNERGSSGGYTRARLDELLLEWAPKLEKSFSADDLQAEVPLNGIEDAGFAHVFNRVASDLKVIRNRLDSFYWAAIVLVVIFVLGGALDWLGLG